MNINYKNLLSKKYSIFWLLFIVIGILVFVTMYFIVTDIGRRAITFVQPPNVETGTVPGLMGNNCLVATKFSVEDLTRGADRVIHGEVVNITSAWGDDKNIHSTITIKPSESFKQKQEGELIIQQYGGTVDKMTEIISCYPKFAIGEEILVFLEKHPKNPNIFRVKAGFQGKFKIKDVKASRGFSDEVPVNLKDLKTKIKKVTGQESFKPARSVAEIIKDSFSIAGEKIADIFSSDVQAYTFHTDPAYRWFPENIPVRFYMDDDHYPGIGTSHELARAAYSLWLNAGAHVSFSDAGIRNENMGAEDGFNMIIFQDSNDLVSEGSAADTMLFIGRENMTVNGKYFEKLWEADIILAKDQAWAGQPDLLTSVVGHELGHTLGLGDTSDEDTLMFFLEPLSPRTLSQDDINGVKFIYPFDDIQKVSIDFLLDFGPAPITISRSQGTNAWYMAKIKNLTDQSQTVTTDLETSNLPSGCTKYQQIILPGEETFNIRANEARWAVYREMYICYGSTPGVYPLTIKFWVSSDEGLPQTEEITTNMILQR